MVILFYYFLGLVITALALKFLRKTNLFPYIPKGEIGFFIFIWPIFWIFCCLILITWGVEDGLGKIWIRFCDWINK